MVVDEIVVWVGDPEAGWRLICVQERPTSLGLHDQVSFDVVLLFNGVLDEDDVTFDIVSNVVDESHVMRTVKGESSVETGVSTKTSAVRPVDGTDHVEMDSVATNLEGLADLIELNILKSSNQRVVTLRVQEDGSTILVGGRVLWITSVLDVSCEETNFGPHVNEVISVMLDHSEMLELQWLVKGDYWHIWVALINGSDSSLFSLTTIEASSSDGDLFSGYPIDSSAKLDCGGAWLDSLVENSPCWLSLDTMHIKSTVLDSDTLVTEDRQVW